MISHQPPTQSAADPLPCCGRRLRELPLGDSIANDEDSATCGLVEPQPGPVWTNGLAQAADGYADDVTASERAEMDETIAARLRRVECPTWCTRHEHGMSTREPHTIELLNLAVLADDLVTDVPLQVYIAQDLEPGSAPAVHLEIGHQLYQPTGVSLSRSDRARLAAALLTANHLTQQ